PEDDEAEKCNYLLSEARKYVDKHIIFQVPTLDDGFGPRSNQLICRFCQRVFVRPKNLEKHERQHQEFISASDESRSVAAHTSSTVQVNNDYVYNYTHSALVLCMFRRNHCDAIHMGDGERVLRLYKYFYLFYKVSNCPKYAYAALELLAQTMCLLTPRLAHRLTWNRFVNLQGKTDSNHPMDLDVEHENKVFKNDITSYRGEITQKTISRVSLSVKATECVVTRYDKDTK
ncbi:uncharacterized protein LOC144360285, partial [Saccoglossus kowalevskii]